LAAASASLRPAICALQATDARFAVPAARLGLAYPADAMIDIVTSSGDQMARYLTMTAAAIDAVTAHRAGFLLNCAGKMVLLYAWEIARTIAANAPLSIKASRLGDQLPRRQDAKMMAAAKLLATRRSRAPTMQKAALLSRAPQTGVFRQMTLVDADARALRQLYNEPTRHYHNNAHIEDLLGQLAQHHNAFDDPETVEAAIWFHDAIYDSTAKDNEAQSAALAADWLRDTA
jgi:hypothetical protein